MRRQIRVELPEAVEDVIKRIISTGMFGRTVEEAAERLICEGLRRVAVDFNTMPAVHVPTEEVPQPQMFQRPDDVIRFVALKYGRRVSEIVGPRRPTALCEPRFVAMWICRLAFPGMTLEYIGECFGNRDHGTVLNAVRRVEGWRSIYTKFREKTDEMLNEVKVSVTTEVSFLNAGSAPLLAFSK